MIYTQRAHVSGVLCTIIPFRGYEISVSLDTELFDLKPSDRPSGSIAVFDSNGNVTGRFANVHREFEDYESEEGFLERPTGEDLFKVMEAIARERPATTT